MLSPDLGFHYEGAGEFWTVTVPFWFITAAALALWGGWKFLSRAAIERRRVRAGLCPRCCYDLRATPGRCPECGSGFSDIHANAAICVHSAV